MANPYFNKTGNPASHSSGASSLIRAEIASIEAGFDTVDTDITTLEATATSLQTQVNKKSAKNFILNGRFNVQQDIQSIINAVNGDYIGDVWHFGKGGTTATYNLGVNSVAGVPAVAAAGELFTNTGVIHCTGVDAAVAAGDYVFIRNDIEGYDWRNLAQRDLKLGFWVYSVKAGIFCVSLRNSISDRSFVAEYTVNAPNTWEFKEITIPASPAAGTWDYTNGIGCQVTWTLMAGATYHTAAGAWQTGNYLATSNQVNFSDNANNYFYITGVKLSAEDQYSAIEPEDFQQELARVQRRYWRGLPCQALNFAAYTIGSVGSWAIKTPVTMRATPTLASDFTGITLASSNVPTVAQPKPEGFRLQGSSTAISGNCNFVFAANNYIEADARF